MVRAGQFELNFVRPSGTRMEPTILGVGSNATGPTTVTQWVLAKLTSQTRPRSLLGYVESASSGVVATTVC
jgi:hypothetical protein